MKGQNKWRKLSLAPEEPAKRSSKNGGDIAFFVDKKQYGKTKFDKKIISYEQLADIYKKYEGRYEILVAAYDLNVKLDMADQLEWMGIQKYKDGIGFISQCLHVFGIFPNLKYEYDREWPLKWRIEQGTIPLLKEMFNKYVEFFNGKSVDFYVFCEDVAVYAERIRKYLGLESIFAYYTEYSYDDTVVPIPDMRFYMGIDEESKGNLDCSINKLMAAGDEKWIDNRIFWSGNLANDYSRRKLYLFGQRHPDKLCIYGNYSPYGTYEWGNPPIKLTEFAQYKYLIDVRGSGWTDRVKWMLALKRPLFLVNRPYKEYYMGDLVPMKHYIPIKEDMSDLIEQYDFIENNPKIYKEIVENASRFVLDHFSHEKVCAYLKKTVFEHGLII